MDRDFAAAALPQLVKTRLSRPLPRNFRPMRWTQALIPTLKETPADAEIVSHKLLLRAGLIRKLTGGVYESYGRGWLIKPKPEDEQYLKEGEWNEMKIKVVGDELTSWLNGHQMVQLKDEKIGAGRGFIALQIHDGGGIKVRWKDIVIQEVN